MCLSTLGLGFTAMLSQVIGTEQDRKADVVFPHQSPAHDTVSTVLRSTQAPGQEMKEQPRYCQALPSPLKLPTYLTASAELKQSHPTTQTQLQHDKMLVQV